MQQMRTVAATAQLPGKRHSQYKAWNPSILLMPSTSGWTQVGARGLASSIHSMHTSTLLELCVSNDWLLCTRMNPLVSLAG